MGQKGFTLIEILVAIAIISIVSVVGIPNIRQFNTDQAIDNAANDIVRVLRQAQSSSMNGIKCQFFEDPSNNNFTLFSSVWKVKLSNNGYSLLCTSDTNITDKDFDGRDDPPRSTKLFTDWDPVYFYSSSCGSHVSSNTEAQVIFNRSNVYLRCIYPAPAAPQLLEPPFQLELRSANTSTKRIITIDAGGSITISAN